MIRDGWQFALEVGKAARDGVAILLHGPTVPAGVSAAAPSPAPPAGPLDTSAVTPRLAEDDPAGDPPSPAGSPLLTWIDWAIPAICDVLADHIGEPDDDGSILCYHVDGAGWAAHGRFDDWHDWREHVAPLIAIPLTAPSTGGLTNAADTFPQHRK